MRYVFLVLISQTLFISSVRSQDSTGRISEGFLRCVVNINFIRHDSSFTGTGFIVSKGLSDGRRALYLVTNKHMIGDYGFIDAFKPYEKITVDFYKTNSAGTIPIDIPIQNSRWVYLHKSPLVDVAAINISYVFSDTTIAHNSLDTTYLVRMKDFSGIQIGFGSQVFALGYPAGIKNFKSNQAIGKAGYIASSISEELQVRVPVIDNGGKFHVISPSGKYFLVDGLIVGGNSGGPIVNPNEVKTRFKGGNMEVSSVPIPNLVLGIVSFGIGNTGITCIYSADEILDLINQN